MKILNIVLTIALLLGAAIGGIWAYNKIAPLIPTSWSWVPSWARIPTQGPAINTSFYVLTPPIDPTKIVPGPGQNPIATMQANAPRLIDRFRTPADLVAYLVQFQPYYTLGRIDAAAAEAIAYDSEGQVLKVSGWTVEQTRLEVGASVQAFVATGFLYPTITSDVTFTVVNTDTVKVSSVISPCITFAGIPIATNDKGTPVPGIRIEAVSTPSAWARGSGLLTLNFYKTDAEWAQLAVDAATSKAINQIFARDTSGSGLYKAFVESLQPGAVWIDPLSGVTKEGAYPIVKAVLHEATCEWAKLQGFKCDDVKFQYTVKAAPEPTQWYWCGTGKLFVAPPSYASGQPHVMPTLNP